MVKVFGAGTIPVNGPNDPFTLTRSQLWQALQRKIRHPSEFVPVISGCKVHKDEHGVVETNLMLTYVFEWDVPSMQEGTAEHKELTVDMSKVSGSTLGQMASVGAVLLTCA